MSIKTIWADPVWSKVIAVGIVALLTAAYASTHWWAQVSSFAGMAWNYAVADATMPRWLVALLALWSAATVILLGVVVIDSKRETVAPWTSYNEDMFLGLRWRWNLYGTSTPSNLCSFCPSCDYQLRAVDDGDYLGNRTTRYQCSNCAATSASFHESNYEVEHDVMRRIQLALRDGSWKNARRREQPNL